VLLILIICSNIHFVRPIAKSVYCFIIKPTRCTNFTNLFLVWNSYLFRTVPLSIIRSLFTVQSSVVYVIQVCRHLSNRTRMEPVPSWSFSKVVYKSVWYVPLLSVQWINSWWWTEELSETCRISCQNKFGKLVYRVGFIIKKPCRKFVSKRKSEHFPVWSCFVIHHRQKHCRFIIYLVFICLWLRVLQI
jgi:hypothetical protein